MMARASTLAYLATAVATITATLQQQVGASSATLYVCQNGQCVLNARGLPLSECEQVCAPLPNATYICQANNGTAGSQCVISSSGLPKAECTQVCGGAGPAPPPSPPSPPPPPTQYTCQVGFCEECPGGCPWGGCTGTECVSKADCYQACGSSSIVDRVIATSELSTFYTALKASSANERNGESDDLVDLLGGGLGNLGPFTVFAPSNTAFTNLPPGVLANLLDPKNKAALNNVLTNHVVAGDILVRDLKDKEQLTTIEGKDLLVRVGNPSNASSGSVYINSAMVTTRDLSANNGLVHIIDTVLIPTGPADGNHLWFRGFTLSDPFGLYQCGEVDAGPRMPAALFDPTNAVALKAFTDATIALFTFCNTTTWGGKRTDGCAKTPFLELGRCAAKNYTRPGYEPFETVKWAPQQLMDGVCKKQCMCNFSGNKTVSLPKCQDTPDDPKAGKFCSLCGPKYNKPIEIGMFECPDTSSCPGPNKPLLSCAGRCDIAYDVNLPCQCNQNYCGFFLDNCCDDYDTACNI